ncbi:MAG TPA: hypothetical protein PKG60_11170 [Spirochaetota bacterium]|nr:hypothetical protein [Spirochaetota bacterium]HPS86421.1 hypothetical protein [Spirochaetota bacterium]
MNRKIRLIIITIVLISANAYAQDQNNSYNYIKLPVIETPYNFSSGYSFPGMSQSLFITAGVSKATHQVIYGLFEQDKNCLQFAAFVIWDYFLFTLPGGPAWLHEEWHRAVMGQYGIDSYNDVYKFDLFADTIAVSHVKDEDLAYLKENHNPDMVRLAEAGNETEIELTREYRRDSFFNTRPIRYELFQMWLTLINSSYYVIMCGTDEADTMTEQMNHDDGTDIPKRDFTGLDFTAWIYDLSRPDELYSARGVHPSGTGIDRYIKYSDLSDSEKKYLKKTGWLTLLNFISPQLFGIERFALPDTSGSGSSQLNFMMIHHLTSFGNDIILSLLYKKDDLNIETSFHCYNNEKNYFPGMEIAVKRYPVSIFRREIYTDCKIMAYSQPEDQEFREDDSEPGGMIGAGFSIPLPDKDIEFFIEGDAKSDGWIEGNLYLGQSIQMRSGIIIHI